MGFAPGRGVKWRERTRLLPLGGKRAPDLGQDCGTAAVKGGRQCLSPVTPGIYNFSNVFDISLKLSVRDEYHLQDMWEL